MNDDDYLWDKSGEPDPGVRELEGKLSRFAWKPRELAARPRATTRESSRTAPLRARIALAAGIAAVSAAALWSWEGRHASGGTGVSVVALAGAPRVGGVPVAASPVPLAANEEIVTPAAARARVVLAAGIGYVDVEPATAISLREASAERQRLVLERGVIHAQVVAPPRLFVVDTPAATAIDLGCAYTLSVDSHGAGTLSVTSGWVELARGPRVSVVPAGAACEMRPGVGPGTPYYTDASAAFRAALARVDGGRIDATDVGALVAEARPRDALTLVHVLPLLREAERRAVVDQLSALSPPPAGVTAEAVVALQPWALMAWRDAVVDADVPWKGLDPRDKLLPEIPR